MKKKKMILLLFMAAVISLSITACYEYKEPVEVQEDCIKKEYKERKDWVKMVNKKADNQWFGKGFEIAIYIIFNNLSQSNPFPAHISELEWQTLLYEARGVSFVTPEINWA